MTARYYCIVLVDTSPWYRCAATIPIDQVHASSVNIEKARHLVCTTIIPACAVAAHGALLILRAWGLHGTTNQLSLLSSQNPLTTLRSHLKIARGADS